ncbi:hypothetical protein CHU92_02080 [Flavobacterium cyanobacteriorum]|uniref:Schlafen AlbA-2 domain-containing protein n=1 Tax=Flavobacterium cyanobacteriorum TaxID=2022802 RepID=A0A255ZWJ9_9FLAO|nr:RNA-binding domain-containing protein [Flavobacterium cyanobacteriorum]OYQ45294.1 hypothetical protein CHU92_02080 [Flavobacterium cyanobacteriorum]
MKSEFIRNTIAAIQKSIQSNSFIDVEKSNIELKDLSTNGEWKSLNETICAFLNTDGGIIICGIKERDKKYSYTGFNRNNESKLIDLHTKYFQDDFDKFIDLSENIFFEYMSLTVGEVVVIVVYPVSDDKKYLRFDGKYYERKLTQDRIIPPSKILHQKEYKAEVEYAKELTKVDGATINDLSIDKVNHYVHLLNREIRNETLKADLTQAKAFLIKQHFLSTRQKLY